MKLEESIKETEENKKEFDTKIAVTTERHQRSMELITELKVEKDRWTDKRKQLTKQNEVLEGDCILSSN